MYMYIASYRGRMSVELLFKRPIAEIAVSLTKLQFGFGFMLLLLQA